MAQQQLFSENERKLKQSSARLPWLGWTILALTAMMSVIWSAHKLLEQDEIFSLQTDRVNSLAEVFKIQKLYPISLEPPPYHVMAHTAMAVFGPTAFSLRLPALAGYLVMQFCLFFFVRNLVGEGEVARRAGLVAMAIPAMTWTLYYSAEGRPYGVLLGSYAATALCWQIAARRGDIKQVRIWPLVGLALALTLTLNVHFYGVLLLVALCGAEAVRTISRRRIDGGVLIAIVFGIVSLVATIPYVKSSGEFRKHYYAGPVSVHMLTQPYRQMLIDYTMFSKAVQTIWVVVLLASAFLVFAASIQMIRKKKLSASRAEWAMVFLLVLLPLFAFVLGRFVTHALEVRHSIGAIVGISALVGIVLLPMIRRRRSYAVLMTALFIGITWVNLVHIRASMIEGRKTMEKLTIDPKLKMMIDEQPDKNIYFQNLGEWEMASQYEPDEELRSRLILVYSRKEEMEYEQHDTMYLTATHTQRFSLQKIMSYDDLRKQAGDHMFTTYPGSGWDWTGAAFLDEASQAQFLGKGFGGDVVKVRFKQ